MRLLLRHYRIRHQLTQRALADRTGLSTSGISKIESGKRSPQWSTIVRISRALDVPPHELIDWPTVDIAQWRRERRARGLEIDNHEGV